MTLSMQMIKINVRAMFISKLKTIKNSGLDNDFLK